MFNGSFKGKFQEYICQISYFSSKGFFPLDNLSRDFQQLYVQQEKKTQEIRRQFPDSTVLHNWFILPYNTILNFAFGYIVLPKWKKASGIQWCISHYQNFDTSSVPIVILSLQQELKGESKTLGQILKQIKLTLKIFKICDCIQSSITRNGWALIVFPYLITVKPGQEETCKICIQKFKTQPQNGEHHPSNISLTRKHVKPTIFPSPQSQKLCLLR